MDLAQLQAALGEASFLDAAALRGVLLRRGVGDTLDLTAEEWQHAVKTAYLRLPRHLRPKTA